MNLNKNNKNKNTQQVFQCKVGGDGDGMFHCLSNTKELVVQSKSTHSWKPS